MQKIIRSLTAVLVLLFVATAGWADHHSVQIKKKEGLGNYLADARGMTLYWFKKDVQGKSNCDAGCLEKWPIYYRESVAAAGGLDGADFGTITRPDGAKQTTFRGWPLYYFAGDKSAGDTAGQGLRDVWYVIDPATFPPK